MRYRWILNEQLKVEVTRSIPDRDVPPTDGELLDAGFTGMVNTMRRAVEAPYLTIPLHMSWNGQHVAKANVHDVLEASSLNQDAIDLPVEKRGPLMAEISKITGA